MNLTDELDQFMSTFKARLDAREVHRETNRPTNQIESRETSFNTHIRRLKGPEQEDEDRVWQPPQSLNPCADLCAYALANYTGITLHALYETLSDPFSSVPGPCPGTNYTYAINSFGGNVTFDYTGGSSCAWSAGGSGLGASNWSLQCAGGIWRLRTDTKNGIQVTYTRADIDPLGVYDFSGVTGCIGTASAAALPATLTLTL